MQHEENGSNALSTWLIIVTGILMMIGVVIQASAGTSLDHSLADVITKDQSPLARQWLFAAIGFCVLVASSYIDPAILRWREGSLFQPSLLLLALAVVALGAVWVPGIGVIRNSRARWIDLGVIGFQASELAKPAIVVFLAAFLSGRKTRKADPGLWWPMLILALLCGMIGNEDFGTAVLLAAVGGSMLLVRGIRIATLAAWAIPAVGAIVAMFFTHEYRMKRLLGFLRIWEDPFGKGYHQIQSLAAIASGGWTGQGLGSGMAKQGYLPEYRTDFIFALLCEETGILGGGIVILLFTAFVVLGILAMNRVATDDGGFRKLFIFGITATIAFQALMNIAVVTVVAPTKGIALPFISAGGSSLLIFCLTVGLLAGAVRPRQADMTGMATLGVSGPLPDPAS